MSHFPKNFLFCHHPLPRMFLFLPLIFFLMSCSPAYISRTEQNFSQATADLEKLIPEEKDTSLQAKYHLQLAWLYANHKNPKMDYRKALEEFEAYLTMAPERAQTDEIYNWLSILRALARSEKERLKSQERLEDQVKKNQQLRENIKKLLERNASLEENNASLKNAIERLKTLNLELEKKRKSAK